MVKKKILGKNSEPASLTMLGISCHLKDYRLSFLINQIPGFDLSKGDDFNYILSPPKGEARFSFYSCQNEEKQNSYYLISNRSQEFILIPELKQFDFLLMIDGKCSKGDKESLMKTIRSIPGILTIVESNFSSVRNFENLLTDLEMHVMNIRRIPVIKYQPKLN
jgi:hypothetical protein